MKKPLLLLALSLATVGLVPCSSAQAQETTSSVGLTNYADRTSTELRQLRAQMEAVVQETPLAGQPQLAPYLNALSVAEQALADFKTAPQIELDRRQSELENAKDKAFRLWNDFAGAHRGTESPVNSSPSAVISSAP